MIRTAPRSSLVAVLAATGIASFVPAPAAAQSYDVDCKLILCLAGGFPTGCADALSHMMKRLRKGKSPIGFCAMSDGKEYDACTIDHRMIPATQARGWDCPDGKTLYHDAGDRTEGRSRRTVNTFCYDRSYSYAGGTQRRYTNKTPPERQDIEVTLALEPSSVAAFSDGWRKFHSGLARDTAVAIRYTE